MIKLTIQQAQTAEWALNDVVYFITDNSCSDPDCCGGSYMSRDSYESAKNTLNELGIEVVE